MSKTNAVVSPANAKSFGFNPPRRRRTRPAPINANAPSDADLVAAFLAKNKPTSCPASYADGAVRTSGIYEL